MILDILDELAADNSRLAKEAILTREKNNAILREVFRAAYDPYTNFWIKQIPEYKQIDNTDIGMDEALGQLSYLRDRIVTGNAAIEHLRKVLCNLNPKSAEVISRIIQRDLKCGVGVPTINKIWPGLIATFDVMLAHKDISGIEFPCVGQIKMDGMRCHLYYDGETVKAFSRNGKEIELHGAFDKSAKIMMNPGETWDGELLCERKGKTLSRTEGNGILNKGVRGTISVDESKLIRFVVWDIVDFTSTITYHHRFNELNARFKKAFDHMLDSPFRLISTWVIADKADAMMILQEMFERGEEGLILKNIESLWVPKRTKDLGKMKAEEEADLVVVDWKEGTGKYVGKLGALICETSDGKLQVNVGTGFSDTQRNAIGKNIIGSVITVRYNMIIEDKNSEIKSLFLPRFVDVRLDKSVANSLEELN